MASKRKTKLTIPDSAPLVLIVWNDCQSGYNEAVDLRIPTWTTVGFLAYEDDLQVVVVSAVVNEQADNLLGESTQADSHNILKSVIIYKAALGKTWGEHIAESQQ